MSEKQETIINGIDVSEEIRYCNNCSNLGLDFKTGKFYCSLISHRPDELPEVLSCDDFSANCYIKRLQEENEELKEKNKNYAELMLQQQEISQKYWECIEKIKQAIEVLAETCNVYPLKTNLDKLITNINEALNDRD